MVRRRTDDESGWGDWDDHEDDAPRSSSEDADDESDDLDDVLASERGVTDDGTEISMEVDDQGREVWYAQDPRIPGSSSLGNSLEEAMEGMEDRRREYRELLKRARKAQHGAHDSAGAATEDDLERARREYREKLRRSREHKRRQRGESTP